MRRLALGGVIGPVVFATVTVISAALRPGYSHLHQFISELGATGTPNAHLMNYVGFVPTGVMILAFAASTRLLSPRRRSVLLGSVLLMVFGAGIVTAGLASCDVGCPQGTGSLANRIHDGMSPIAFFAALCGIAAIGVAMRRIDGWRGLGHYSLVTSALGLILMLGLVQSLASRTFTGLWQRLFLITVFSWCGVVGLRLFSKHPAIQRSNP